MTKKTTKLGLIVLAAATVSTAGLAMAKDREGREDKGQRGGIMRMLQDVDQNADGAFSREEVTTFIEARFTEADADKSASLTAEEIAEAMPQRRGGKSRGSDHADRMMKRVDINEDGSVTLAELQDRQEKFFALMDVDNSGVIDQDEMPKRGRDGGRSDK